MGRHGGRRARSRLGDRSDRACGAAGRGILCDRLRGARPGIRAATGDRPDPLAGPPHARPGLSGFPRCGPARCGTDPADPGSPDPPPARHRAPHACRSARAGSRHRLAHGPRGPRPVRLDRRDPARPRRPPERPSGRIRGRGVDRRGLPLGGARRTSASSTTTHGATMWSPSSRARSSPTRSS